MRTGSSSDVGGISKEQANNALPSNGHDLVDGEDFSNYS